MCPAVSRWTPSGIGVNAKGPGNSRSVSSSETTRSVGSAPGGTATKAEKKGTAGAPGRAVGVAPGSCTTVDPSARVTTCASGTRHSTCSPVAVALTVGRNVGVGGAVNPAPPTLLTGVLPRAIRLTHIPRHSVIIKVARVSLCPIIATRFSVSQAISVMSGSMSAPYCG